jgi:hypothetical protein
MVCSRTILGLIVSNEGKTPNPKKIKALVKMLVPKTSEEIQVFNGMPSFTHVSLENLPLLWQQSPSYLEKLKCLNALLNVKPLGRISKIGTFKSLYISILIGNYNFMFTLICLI